MSNASKFGQAPIPMTLGALPSMPQDTPRELIVQKHLVGYTEVHLSNGDVIRLHLHVDRFVYNPLAGGLEPTYRVVPEVVKKTWNNCAPHEGPLS